MSFIIHCRSGMAVELEVNGTGQGRWGCLGRSCQPLTLIASAAEETVSKTGAWLTERAHWSYCEPQLQSGWAEVRWWERLCSPIFVSIRSFVHSSTLPSFLPSLLSPLLSAAPNSPLNPFQPTSNFPKPSSKLSLYPLSNSSISHSVYLHSNQSSALSILLYPITH